MSGILTPRQQTAIAWRAIRYLQDDRKQIIECNSIGASEKLEDCPRGTRARIKYIDRLISGLMSLVIE